MRPNLAQDAPPTSLQVGGGDYPVNWDYRAWLEITAKMGEIVPEADTPDDMQRNMALFEEIQALAFGGVLADEAPEDVLRAVANFARGYPSAPIAGEEDHRGGTPLYSLDYDLNEILLAIRNQGGPDLSYRRKEPYHWWEFLLEVRTLAGEHYITRLMEIRGYSGKDKELLAMKARYALPERSRAAHEQLLNDLDALFYNS